MLNISFHFFIIFNSFGNILMTDFFLTVFTPTYNRANLLKNAFKSLNNQSCFDFEWLIIDDGSIDNTQDVVKDFKTEKFTIRYFKQQNGGKHRAINQAVQLAKGKFFLILDSDDELKENAVEMIRKFCNQISTLPNYNQFAGVAGERISREGKLLCGKGTKDYFVDATNLQRKKYHLGGDMAEVYKTSLLKEYPFKEFNNENFLTENTVWDKIAEDGYKIRWFKEPFYVCDYLNDGLTKNLLDNESNSFEGFTYATCESIRLGDFTRKVHSVYEYWRVAKNKKLKMKDISRRLNSNIFFLSFCILVSKIYLLFK